MEASLKIGVFERKWRKRMRCILMHKHVYVTELELDGATRFIKKINSVYKNVADSLFWIKSFRSPDNTSDGCLKKGGKL